MSKNESVEEKKFKKRAEELWDAEVIKLMTAGRYGRVGRSDRLILIPSKPFAIPMAFEFKKVGKGPTKIQIYYRDRFRRMGIPTYVVYTSKEAIRLCKKAIRTKALPKGIHKIRRK